METLVALRPDLEPLPDRMKGLPLDDKGYPVPYFAAFINGKPELRAASPAKKMDCILSNKCWVCGNPLGRYMAFVSGPMCGINRVSAEPPSHYECAAWSARNCPFLSNKNRKRREDEIINADTAKERLPGHFSPRNPGVALVWITRDYSLFSDGKGGALIRMGEPERLEFYANGELATLEEFETALAGSTAVLAEMAKANGPADEELLAALTKKFKTICRGFFPQKGIK